MVNNWGYKYVVPQGSLTIIYKGWFFRANYKNCLINVSGELIHPCKVVLHQLPLSVNVNANSSSNSDNGLNANSNIQSNPQDAKFECDPTKRRCRKMFPTVEDKQVHISKFHVGKKYKFSKKARCIYCDKMVFTNKMKAHVQKSHENKPFIRCSYNNYQCNTYFQSLEEKKEHEEEFHNAVGKGKETDKLKCIYCDLADVKRCLLKKHMQSHHKSIAIRCNFHKLCSTYFHTEAERDEHVQNVHRRTCWQLPDGVECVYCKKICRDKKQLLDHVSSVHFLVRIKCGAHRCTQFFLSQSDCDQHFEEKHREEEDKKMFHCHDCGYRALRKINLTRHVSQKHLNSEFECPLCARVLHSKCAVNKHLRKVHVKSQQCRYCNTEVKFLKQHQKQLQCKVCNEMLPCLTSAARHGEICKEWKYTWCFRR